MQGAHVVTGVQTQGRFDRGRGQEYVEGYTLEYRRPGFTRWRPYKRWDNKEVRQNRRTSGDNIYTKEVIAQIGLFAKLAASRYFSTN